MISAALLVVERCRIDSLRLTAVWYTPEQGVLAVANFRENLSPYTIIACRLNLSIMKNKVKNIIQLCNLFLLPILGSYAKIIRYKKNSSIPKFVIFLETLFNVQSPERRDQFIFRIGKVEVKNFHAEKRNIHIKNIRSPIQSLPVKRSTEKLLLHVYMGIIDNA